MPTVRTGLKDARLLGAVVVSLGAHLCFLLLLPAHDVQPSASSSASLTAHLMPRTVLPRPVVGAASETSRERFKSSHEALKKRTQTSNGRSELNVRANQYADQNLGRSPGVQKGAKARAEPAANSGASADAHLADSSPALSSAASRALIDGGLQSSAKVGAAVPADASVSIDASISTEKSSTAEISPMPRSTVQSADPGAVARYRMTLMGAMASQKNYPEAARQQQWQGRCELDVEFGNEGGLRELHVAKSSGYDLLDDSARDMLRAAQLRTPVPAMLLGRAFNMRIVVVFDLQEN